MTLKDFLDVKTDMNMLVDMMKELEENIVVLDKRIDKVGAQIHDILGITIDSQERIEKLENVNLLTGGAGHQEIAERIEKHETYHAGHHSRIEKLENRIKQASESANKEVLGFYERIEKLEMQMEVDDELLKRIETLERGLNSEELYGDELNERIKKLENDNKFRETNLAMADENEKRIEILENGILTLETNNSMIRDTFEKCIKKLEKDVKYCRDFIYEIETGH